MKYPQLVSMPSAVSDWLEEQLDARGIDAVVYTRYVLSLLHRDTLDLVSTDQDIQIPKEVRQSGRGRKRFRRSAEWWSHVRADVEQLRRSAAVECLMSAADQKCGIESLVDELCEKLKHFESSSTETAENSEDTSVTKKLERVVVSPADLARRYYAAFPPLSCKSASANLITLLPQLCTNSQRRRHIRKPAVSTFSHRSASRDKLPRKTDLENMKSRSGGKRFTYFSRNKRDFGFARSLEKSSERSDVMSDWDMYFMNSQNRIGDEGYSTSDTTGVDESEDAVTEMEQLESAGGKNKTSIDDGHLAKLVAKFDRKIEALWSTDETCIEQNNENEYHDLPVDIQELLSSPTKQTAALEILNVANKRANDKSAKAFIQCGTNITSSIWTECVEDEETDKSLYDSINYCNLFNEALETYPEKILGDQFNSLSVAADKSNDSFNSLSGIDKIRVAENETNMLYENFSTENNNKISFGSLKPNDFTSLPWELAFSAGSFNNKKWSDAENYSYVGDSKFCSPLERNVSRAVNDSLITLNHNKEASCFKEVVPKQVLGLPSVFNNTSSTNETKIAENPEPVSGKEEEDLLTSARTHFRPIKQESSEVSSGGNRYADGTTFAIRSSLEHVNYRRSESGTLYLESGFDTPKKYMEYRLKDAAEQLKGDTDSESCYSIEKEFVLKFCVKQNEKCCQTELEKDDDDSVQSHSPLEVPAKKRVLCDPDEFFFPGDDELLSESDVAECSCATRGRAKLATSLEPLFNASSEACSLHGRDSTAPEINWRKCDTCNNNWWPKAGADTRRGEICAAALQHIWSSSEELCRSCLAAPGAGPPPGRSLEYFKLREELSEDGEQLLSDLSCLQRVYMEQLPTSEVSCDLNETIAGNVEPVAAQPLPTSGSKERKRRHSSSQRPSEVTAAAVARNSWTNSACLRPEQRCVFTPPLLRPVTL